jgi:two-component system nitrate/nitrite response regulator NarL
MLDVSSDRLSYRGNATQARQTAYLLVVDSDPVAQVGIAHMLSDSPWLTVGACVRTWREALTVARVTQPDIALVGLRPPGRAIRQLCDSAPGIRLVLFAPRAALRSVTTASVAGLIPRDAGASSLENVLRRVSRGERVLVVADEDGPTPGGQDLHGLTRREYDILRRVAMGETNAEIARALGLATNTVKTYFQRALEKLGARNRMEAVTYATEIGLL